MRRLFFFFASLAVLNASAATLEQLNETLEPKCCFRYLTDAKIPKASCLSDPVSKAYDENPELSKKVFVLENTVDAYVEFMDAVDFSTERIYQIYEAQEQKVRFDNIELKLADKSSQSTVYVFKNNGKTFFFRPLNSKNVHAVRKTLAASALNRLFGLNTVPHATLGMVNGKLGSISDEAPGTISTDGKNTADVDVESFINTAIFEFIVGQIDGSWGNSAVAKEGTIKVFDHDNAFLPGLHQKYLARGPFPFGRALPSVFSTRFEHALRAVSLKQIRQAISPFLVSSEISSVLFRSRIAFHSLEEQH